MRSTCSLEYHQHDSDHGGFLARSANSVHPERHLSSGRDHCHEESDQRQLSPVDHDQSSRARSRTKLLRHIRQTEILAPKARLSVHQKSCPPVLQVRALSFYLRYQPLVLCCSCPKAHHLLRTDQDLNVRWTQAVHWLEEQLEVSRAGSSLRSIFTHV